MKKVNLVQNTPEWLNWRRQGVGASDVPTLLGLNPYKTRRRFLDEWQGFHEHPDDSGTYRGGNVDTARGVRLESVARDLLSEQLLIPFTPQCGEWEGDNFLRASLDGYSEEHNLICEIKAPRGFKKMSDANIYQVQTQLLVSGATECVFCQIVEKSGGPELQTQRVKADPAIQEAIIRAVGEFKQEVNFEEPLRDEELLWKNYLQAKTELEAAEQKFRMAETGLKSCLGSLKEKHFTADDGRTFQLSRSLRKGNIDYKSIPVLNEIDLEPYRKGSIELLLIRELKGTA